MKLEFKKYFSNKYILIFLITMLIFNSFYLIKKYSLVERRSVQNKEFYMTFYPSIKGDKTEEKVKYIKNKSNEMEKLYSEDIIQFKNEQGKTIYTYGSKMAIELSILPDMEYCYLYYNQNKDLVNDAKENLSNISDKKSFRNKYLKLLIDKFESRNIPKFGLTRGYEVLFSYNLSVLFCMLLIIVPISQIFAKEKDKEYDILVLSRKDRIRWGVYKIKTAIFSAVMVMLLFYIVDIVAFNNVWNMDYPLNPIYSIKSFRYTGFNLSIIEYMGFNLFIKIFAVVFMAYIFILNSITTKNVSKALLKNVISICFIIIANDIFNLKFLPLNLLTNQKFLTDFNVTNVFGIAVQSFQINLILSIFVVLILRIIVYRSIRRW